MRKYVLISFLLHLIFIVGLSLHFNGGSSSEEGGSKKEQGKGQGNSSSDNTFVPKGSMEISVVPPQAIESPIETPDKKSKGVKECVGNNWYGGIGIKQNFETGAIAELAEGYPAQKAGLLIGDMILRVNGEVYGDIRGEPGTEVIIEVYRPSTNKTASIRLIRDKICIK